MDNLKNVNRQTKEKIEQVKKMIKDKIELKQIIKEKFNTQTKKNSWLDKNNIYFSSDELLYLNYSIEILEPYEELKKESSSLPSLVNVKSIEELSANERLKILLADETLKSIQKLLNTTTNFNPSSVIPIEYTQLNDIKLKNCRMSESIYNRLVDHCKKNNLTITSVLNFIIDSYLKNI